MLQENSIVYKLTLLWIFTEGILGGLMHLLHIPMTGFIVGGISVILNVFIAKYSSANSKVMLSSLGLVLLCKFGLSPQSPLGAYVAVSFQGLLSIFIFRLLQVHSLSVVLYAVIVMLENAIQKPLMAYIIFGDELIHGITMAVNKFFKNKEWTENFFLLVTIAYFSIYALWGIVISRWTLQFLSTIEKFSLDINYTPSPKGVEHLSIRKNKKSILSVIVLSFLFFFSIAYFTASSSWYIYLGKTILWMVILGYVLPKLLSYILHYFSNKESSQIASTLAYMPDIKQNFYTSLELIKHKKGLAKIKHFIFLMMYLTVFRKDHVS